MRIRNNPSLPLLIIIACFSIITFFLTRNLLMKDRMKELAMEGRQSISLLSTFQKQTELFGMPGTMRNSLWRQWLLSYRQFDLAHAQFLENKHLKQIDGNLRRLYEEQTEVWKLLKKNAISPAIIDVENFLDGANPNRVVSDTNIRKLIESLSPPLANQVQTPTELLIKQTEHDIDNSSINVLLSVLTILTFLITGISLLAGIPITKNLRNIINSIEGRLVQVTTTNPVFTEEAYPRGDLGEAARYLGRVTKELWSRVEKLKDIMKVISSSIDENMNPDELEQQMLDLAIESTRADAGFLMGMEEDNLVLRKIRGRFPPPMPIPSEAAQNQAAVLNWFESIRIQKKQGVLGEILETGDPLFVRNNLHGELPDNANMTNSLYIHSALFVPVVMGDQVQGVLGLARTHPDAEFTDLDYSYMQSYGNFMGITLDNIHRYADLLNAQKIQREIEVAADIQRTLLPQKMPVLSGASIGAFSDAAKGVSGDYFDIFNLGEGKSAIVICDVAGKGVPASLLMIMIRTVIRSISRPGKRSDQILKHLNEVISGRLSAGLYATISLILLDSKQNILSYSNGAHHPLHILKQNPLRYRKFDTEGLPVGMTHDALFEHKAIRVDSGDILVLFTDGLPEARNRKGKEMGTNHLLRFVARHAEKSPAEIARRVKTMVQDFTYGTSQHDDQTFLAVKIQ